MIRVMTPLADRMRPTKLDEYIGQSHILSADKLLYRAIKNGQLFSMILWGPPGVGKTTLARLIANEVNAEFLEFSAINTSIAELKKIFERVKLEKDRIKRDKLFNSGLVSKDPGQARMTNQEELFLLSERSEDKNTIVFIDEIHRFSKSQQDAFLPYVENGTITLIGATTENPSFEIIAPLLSRTRVFTLEQFSKEELVQLIDRALKDKEKGLGKQKIKIEEDALDFLIDVSNGDGRRILNTLEIAVLSRVQGSGDRVQKIVISREIIEEAIQKRALGYDKGGEEHYNTISAFIKSMRASNPDAALYYLSRMIEAGEDPLFIARRMVIFASEDIGMAAPTALVVANEVFRSCEIIGYPECAINLAHGVVYLSTAKKDRRAYDGLRSSQKDVRDFGNLPIPKKLRNAPTKLMKDEGYGEGYEMYGDEDLLPEKLKGKKYYEEK